MNLADESWDLVRRVRERAPLVQTITNFVAMDAAANAVLAIGGSPAMVHAVEEVAEFVAVADALTINIGTLSSGWVDSMRVAARTAVRLDKPWVLDPVGVGATTFRRRTATELLDLRPTIVRGNASEIIALAGLAQARQKGVDSTQSTAEAEASASLLARTLGSTVVVTGAIDLVTDGERTLRIANGHPLMTRVTALGCALTAVTGAFAAIEKNTLHAAAAATAIFGLAGEIAARQARGPGSLRVALMDALHGLDAETVRGGVRIDDA
ncbi:hydroxyethylthiazole kinase [Reyranella sp. CPCC 100927]|uniref:hydroxyethylthiazole kinase n=1 Tax=Reyranella sp. CPCC 100927 TaxID=2599616 RepID=UPI0011B77DD7|nr:hydroxyethylthiazole kinase [Reyranella sp. CPCC 100927]TWS99664.1 hydroxyethylthiazole kinase [Reyranella sp. CPCC 100927]